MFHKEDISYDETVEKYFSLDETCQISGKIKKKPTNYESVERIIRILSFWLWNEEFI